MIPLLFDEDTLAAFNTPLRYVGFVRMERFWSQVAIAVLLRHDSHEYTWDACPDCDEANE